jgi:hypothetical protein
MSQLARWLAGEPIRVRSQRMVLVVVTLAAASLAYAYVRGSEITRHLRKAKQHTVLPADRGDVRFGLPLEKRRQIFTELAAAEPQARVEGVRAFNGPGLEWSAEDHRGGFERREIAAVMTRHRVTMTQAYLVLDEGIRSKWPGPDGQPLKATVTPLHPRRNYGW